jgi:hypothetical protein
MIYIAFIAECIGHDVAQSSKLASTIGFLFGTHNIANGFATIARARSSQRPAPVRRSDHAIFPNRTA